MILTQGKNVLRGDRLVVDMTTGVSRVESDSGKVQGMFQSSGQGGPVIGLSGQFTVKEAYAEVRVPIMEGQPFADLLSFNEYIGWYDGLPDKLPNISWSLAYNKPVVISEFGADAKQGFHADRLTRFSEEYQTDVYRQTLAMLGKIPQWRGATPWILCDFRSPRRPLPNVQDGWNRKGLIGANGIRKEAFAVLKAFYDAQAAAGK